MSHQISNPSAILQNHGTAEVYELQGPGVSENAVAALDVEMTDVMPADCSHSVSGPPTGVNDMIRLRTIRASGGGSEAARQEQHFEKELGPRLV